VVSDTISTWGNEINGTDADGNPASYVYVKTISDENLAKIMSTDS
jgi:beta-glucosidase